MLTRFTVLTLTALAAALWVLVIPQADDKAHAMHCYMCTPPGGGDGDPEDTLDPPDDPPPDPPTEPDCVDPAFRNIPQHREIVERAPSYNNWFEATLETPEFGHARGSIQPSELVVRHEGINSLDCANHCGNTHLVSRVSLNATVDVDPPNSSYSHDQQSGEWYFKSAGSGTTATVNNLRNGTASAESDPLLVHHYLATPEDESTFEATLGGTARVTANDDGVVYETCRNVRKYSNTGSEVPGSFTGLSRVTPENTRGDLYNPSANQIINNVVPSYVDDNNWQVLGSRSR